MEALSEVLCNVSEEGQQAIVDYAVQDILDKVIKAGYFTEEDTALSSNFMCGALGDARRAGVINSVEADLALSEVQGWLFSAPRPYGSAYLWSTLERLDLPYGYWARLSIYSNWANRPDLLQRSKDIENNSNV